MKQYWRELIRQKCYVKCLVLSILLRIHGYTRYPHENRFDVFYWPEGVCADMFVVAGIILMLMWMLKDQVKALSCTDV